MLKRKMIMTDSPIVLEDYTPPAVQPNEFSPYVAALIAGNADYISTGDITKRKSAKLVGFADEKAAASALQKFQKTFKAEADVPGFSGAKDSILKEADGTYTLRITVGVRRAPAAPAAPETPTPVTA